MQQLTEPSSHAGGDPVPCHLFMPDVAWQPVIGPVLRPERARHLQWLQQPVTPWRPGIPQLEREPAPGVHVTRRLVLAGVVGFWVAVGMLVQAARSEAATVVVVRAPVVVARPAPVAPRPAPRPVVHVPAPVVVSPSLAKPPVRCERDGLGQCVEVSR